VQHLPQRLHTNIGSGGVDLSAGQRQRLSLAQAFLRNAPILILDEASSALDSQSEQAITASLEQLRRNRTTIIIAHRYSSLKLAQRIIFLNGDGSITLGEHDQLYQQHLAYREAVDWQLNSAYSNSNS
jgi:ABC-type multidrug transport system fused ATPase/permease subunit